MGDKPVFTSGRELYENMKPINLFVAADGMYEIRRTEVGVFCAKISEHTLKGLESCREFLKMSLPKVPFELLQQVIGLFKKYSFIDDGIECLCQIKFDRVDKKYVVFVPKQTVTRDTVVAVIDPAEYYQQQLRYIDVVEIHSHNTMEARFSKKDDRYEIGTLIYAVVGRLDGFLPDITVRYSCGGNYVEIQPETVFTSPFETYPAEWETQVVIDTSEEETYNGVCVD